VENPYQSPHEAQGVPFAEGGSGGLGHHIRIVAILMMVQGGLELLMGAMLLFMGGMLPSVFSAMPAPPANQGQPAGPPPAMVGTIIGVVYLVLGAVLLIAAVLKLVAGWRNFWFRGRVMGIIALTSGLGTVITCYCFPTALALFVYGLIVYLNPQSARWFALGDQGASPETIQTTW
jgi:hypothetical protein